jgi:hypothetical protein
MESPRARSAEAVCAPRHVLGAVAVDIVYQIVGALVFHARNTRQPPLPAHFPTNTGSNYGTPILLRQKKIVSFFIPFASA